jgi:hypothetical protein
MKVNKYLIDEISNKIKELQGVLNVDVSAIKYDENNDFHFYNNTVSIIFEDTSFRGFVLNKFNQFGLKSSSDKLENYLTKSSEALDDYLNKIENIKKTIAEMKSVIQYIENLEIEKYENVSFVQYAVLKNELSFTIYKNS